MKREVKLQQMLKEIEYELFHYPQTTLKQDIKYSIKRLIKPADTPKRDSFFWTHAMLATALENTGNIEILKKYYDVWMDRGLQIYNIDNVMNGYSLIYIYQQTKEEKYREAADSLYTYICDYKKETKDIIPYRKHHPTHIYVDGVGMIVPFLCRYGAMYDKEEATWIGIDYLKKFLKYGMDEKTGLPYHGYDVNTEVKQGIIGWGRAIGWLLLALTDSIPYLPEGKEKQELQETLGKLLDNCSMYLREDGYYSWQLTAMEGPKDTSATAMIGYAMKKAKWDCERIETALLSSCRDGKIYDCSGECDGFSQYPQIYGAYPWSLGTTVRFITTEVENQIYKQ